MTTFNPGDRIRSLINCLLIDKGEEFTVIRAGQSFVIFADREGDPRNRNPRHFELVPPIAELAAPAATEKAPYKPKTGSRLDQVLTHLLSGKSLTQGEGIVLGYGTRVAASVHELRARGHNIVTTMKEDLKGFPYAEYRLVTRRANGNRKAA